MNHLLIFAGTTEGRELIDFALTHTNFHIYACVATEYGKALLSPHSRLTISSRPLDCEEMCSLMKEQAFSFILDATHPYAVEVSQNIKKAAQSCSLTYYRILRPENASDSITKTMSPPSIINVSAMDEAVKFFQHTTGNILVTTGSKELSALCALTDFETRVYPRILPNPDMLQMIIKQGFAPKNIICMQGPFSEDLNTAILRQINASFLLTKSSGSKGGFPQKLAAAARLKIPAVIIGRPLQTEGISLEQACNLLLNQVF